MVMTGQVTGKEKTVSEGALEGHVVGGGARGLLGGRCPSTFQVLLRVSDLRAKPTHWRGFNSTLMKSDMTQGPFSGAIWKASWGQG